MIGSFLKIRKLFFVLFLLKQDLSAMDWDVFGEQHDGISISTIAKICSVAYGVGSPHRHELNEFGWEFYALNPGATNFLDNNEIIGVLGVNGPLNVISYAGTRDSRTKIVDADIIRAQLSKLFPRLPAEMHVHSGFLNYYSMFGESRAPYLYRNKDQDELFILAGHSLGGACAQLGALDIFHNSPAEYLESYNLSVVTFGSPPLFNAEAAGLMDEILPFGTNLRVVNPNDWVVNLAKREDYRTYWFHNHTPSSNKQRFLHAGYEIENWGCSELNPEQSHWLENYINKSYQREGLSTRNNEDIYCRKTLFACEKLVSIDEDFCEKLLPLPKTKLKKLEDNIHLIDQFSLKPKDSARVIQKYLAGFMPFGYFIVPLMSLFSTFDEGLEYLKYRDELLSSFHPSYFQGREYEGDPITNLLFNKTDSFQFKLSRLPRSERLNVLKNIIVGIAETIYLDSENDFSIPQEKNLDIGQHLFSMNNLWRHIEPLDQMPLKTLVQRQQKTLEEYLIDIKKQRKRKFERLELARDVDYDPQKFEDKIIGGLVAGATRFDGSIEYFNRYSGAYALLPLINPKKAFKDVHLYLKYFSYDAAKFEQALSFVVEKFSQEKKVSTGYLSVLKQMLDHKNDRYRNFAKMLLEKVKGEYEE